MKCASRIVCLIVIGTLACSGTAEGLPPRPNSQPPPPVQPLSFRCQLEVDGKPTVVEVALQIPSLASAAELDQVVALPAPLAPIRLKRYLPRAVCEQRMVLDKGDGANPAIELFVGGPTQSYRQWLVANDIERNRLISLVGKWRYMAVADKAQRDELFGRFKGELSREPVLSIGKSDGGSSTEMPAKPATSRKLNDLNCTIHVREFYPHFGIDGQTDKPTNVSDRRMNPAVLLEVEHGDRREQRWVFARFPAFRVDKSEQLPFRITLDCPMGQRTDTPDFALVTIGTAEHELWRHEGDKSTHKPIALNEPVEVPGSPYAFHMTRFEPSARLIEEYRPTDERRAVAALQIETNDTSAPPTRLWLEKGRQRIISTEKGPMTVAFGLGPMPSSGGRKWPH